jgi:glycosyltransferase involved in cell wall biosynthesis
VRTTTYLPHLEASGGVALHILQATRVLADHGVEVDLHYAVSGNLEGDFAQFCTSMREGPSLRYTGAPVADVLRLTPEIVRTLADRADVLYVNNLTELAWADGVSLLGRIPIVCHLHEVAEFHPNSIRIFGSRVSRFIVASEFMRGEWTRRGIATDRILTIPYGIDDSSYPRGSLEDRALRRRELGLPEDAFVALYMGRLDEVKGVEVLLEAWRRLGWSADESRLLIVGSPELNADPDAYLAHLHALGTDSCTWLPMRPDVIGVLHAADVLVLPSVWQEPFGRVVIEALATGRPVIASRVGGIPEILSDEMSQFLFDRGDADDLARRLEQVRDWRTRDPGLADRCVDHAHGRYALSETAGLLEATLREAARNRRAPRPGRSRP